MYHCSPFRVFIRSYGGNHSGYAGADILPHGNRNRRTVRNLFCTSQRLQNTNLAWNYNNKALGGDAGNENDYLVINQAGVKINNGAGRKTNMTDNPLKPNKTEMNIERQGSDIPVTPGNNLTKQPGTAQDPHEWEGQTVLVDDVITYVLVFFLLRICIYIFFYKNMSYALDTGK